MLLVLCFCFYECAFISLTGFAIYSKENRGTLLLLFLLTTWITLRFVRKKYPEKEIAASILSSSEYKKYLWLYVLLLAGGLMLPCLWL